MIAKLLFSALFIAAGVCHFLFTEMYQRIIPPILPNPRLLVLVSGAIEILLGATLLIPFGSRFAAWGLIALLLAVFPANIYMATHPELFSRIPVWTLWARLPLQFVLIAWAYIYTK